MCSGVCKHKDLPFSLTECFVKKVLESFYGECTPINYISGSAKKQYTNVKIY